MNILTEGFKDPIVNTNNNVLTLMETGKGYVIKGQYYDKETMIPSPFEFFPTAHADDGVKFHLNKYIYAMGIKYHTYMTAYPDTHNDFVSQDMTNPDRFFIIRDQQNAICFYHVEEKNGKITLLRNIRRGEWAQFSPSKFLYNDNQYAYWFSKGDSHYTDLNYSVKTSGRIDIIRWNLSTNVIDFLNADVTPSSIGATNSASFNGVTKALIKYDSESIWFTKIQNPSDLLGQRRFWVCKYTYGDTVLTYQNVNYTNIQKSSRCFFNAIDKGNGIYHVYTTGDYKIENNVQVCLQLRLAIVDTNKEFKGPANVSNEESVLYSDVCEIDFDIYDRTLFKNVTFDTDNTNSYDISGIDIIPFKVEDKQYIFVLNRQLRLYLGTTNLPNYQLMWTFEVDDEDPFKLKCVNMSVPSASTPILDYTFIDDKKIMYTTQEMAHVAEWSDEQLTFVPVDVEIGGIYYVGWDKLGRMWTINQDYKLTLMNSEDPKNIDIKFEKNIYEYEGQSIETYFTFSAVKVDGTNCFGNYKILIEGPATFQDDSKELTFEYSQPIEQVPIIISGSSTVTVYPEFIGQ